MSLATPNMRGGKLELGLILFELVFQLSICQVSYLKEQLGEWISTITLLSNID